jgi:hypothetical protein
MVCIYPLSSSFIVVFISVTLPMADYYFIDPFEISGELNLYTQRKPIYLVDQATSAPIANFHLL